ncbi:hypothetical protein LCGC14_1128670 [marine sediment metagenome]|uniref:Uncharacterized protein n=1 Tax=marine sediment metagenome TaxID=412755 RepID=A0A0F9PK00_9ZZZZ
MLNQQLFTRERVSAAILEVRRLAEQMDMMVSTIENLTNVLEELVDVDIVEDTEGQHLG